MINIPNHVLRRAIILPKDMDTTAGNYPKPGDTLPINYLTNTDYIMKQNEIKRIMAPPKSKKDKKGVGTVKKKWPNLSWNIVLGKPVDLIYSSFSTDR